LHAGAQHKEDEEDAVAVTRQVSLNNVHKGSVYAMDWQAEHQLLASGSNDKMLRICRPFNTDRDAMVGAALKGHSGTVRVLKFRPSGASSAAPLLASAGAGDCRPRLWDVQTESCQRVFSEHSATVQGLVWQDESVFVSGCEDGRLIAHDIRSATPVWSADLNAMVGSTRTISCLSLLGEEGLLGVGSAQGCLSVLREGRLLKDLSLHTADLRCLLPLHYHHTSLLLTASYDSTAALWSLPGLGLGEVSRLSGGHSDKLLSAAAFSRLPAVLTSGADGRVVLWTSST
jgi:WD40 repeat protein